MGVIVWVKAKVLVVNFALISDLLAFPFCIALFFSFGYLGIALPLILMHDTTLPYYQDSGLCDGRKRADLENLTPAIIKQVFVRLSNELS